MAALALVTACGGGPAAPDDSQPPMFVGGVPLAARDPALVGIWFHRSIVTDGTGRVVSVETIWNFANDGTVQRRSITDDINSGIANELVASGSWTTSANTGTGGGTLTVRFDAPTATVLQLAYQIGFDSQGTQLLLDGIVYQRTIQ